MHLEATGIKSTGSRAIAEREGEMRIRLPLLVACTWLLLSGCGDDASDPLVIGTNVWPGYEPLYLARAKGLISDKDVRLVQNLSASEVIRGMRNGVTNAAAVTLDEALLMLADGIDIKIILVFDSSQGGDAIIAQKSIENFQDLVGRNVGAETSALGAYVLCRAAELHKLDCHHDFKITNYEVNEHEEAFSSGKIDAVVTFDPVRKRLIEGGAKIVFDSREIPNEVLDVLVVRTEAINRYGNQIDVLMKGWFKALDIIKENPIDSAELMGKREKLTASEFIDAESGIHIPEYEENIELLSPNGAVKSKSIPNLMRIMLQHGLLPHVIKTDNVINIDFLQKVKK